MKGLKFAFVFSMIVMSASARSAAADDTVAPGSVDTKAAGTSDEARFMMGGNPTELPAPSRDQLTKDDFEWAALTKNSAASGADPVVGSNAKPYYDFKDGQPFPYYVVPAK